MKYAKLTAEQKLNYTGTLKSIRGNRREFWKLVDTAVKSAVPGVLGGDNIGLINRLLSTLSGSDQKDVAKLLKRFVPYKYDGNTGEFTAKLNSDKRCKAIEDAYTEWLRLGRTVQVEIKLMNDVEKPELTPEQVLERDLKGLESKMRTTLEHGATVEQVMAILTALTEEKAAA